MNKYRRARERSGYTQKELGAIIGVEPSVISRYELDTAKNCIVPPTERKESIASACGIPLDFLENTNPALTVELDIGQKARFNHAVQLLNQGLSAHPEETKIQYGNAHPFMYLLKERWTPIIEDVYYLAMRFGTSINQILHDEKDEPASNQNTDFKNPDIEFDMMDKESERFAILEDQVNELYLEYYHDYSDEDLMDEINKYLHYFNRIGRIEILRLIQYIEGGFPPTWR